MLEHPDGRPLRKVPRKALRASRTVWQPSLPGMERLAEPLPKPKGWYVECDRCKAKGRQRKIFAPSPYVVIMILRKHFEEEHELECAFCFLKFAGFKELAIHVTDAHVSETAKAEREAREAWHPNDEMENDMSLPAPGGSRDSNRGGRGGSSTRKPPAVPFVTVADLSKDPVTAKVLGVDTKGGGFNDLIVKMAMNGRAYFLGLKTSNPNYEILFNAFGEDETEWVGKEFTIGLNWNDFYEKSFVHVFEAPAKASSGKPRGKKGE